MKKTKAKEPKRKIGRSLKRLSAYLNQKVRLFNKKDKIFVLVDKFRKSLIK